MTQSIEDPRCLADVVADADWKIAEAFAAATDTEPGRWFKLLQEGVPFRRVQSMAKAFARSRRHDARETAKRKAGGRS